METGSGPNGFGISVFDTLTPYCERKKKLVATNTKFEEHT